MNNPNLYDVEYIKSILLKIKKQKNVNDMFDVWLNEINEYKFEGSTPRSLACRYFKKNGYEIYVRFSVREIEGRYCKCLDIANIFLIEKHRNKSWLKNFISRAMKIEDMDGVYIESVNSKILKQALPNWGFRLVDEVNSNYFFSVSDYLTKQHQELQQI